MLERKRKHFRVRGGVAYCASALTRKIASQTFAIFLPPR
jgi:hypothetical protein